MTTYILMILKYADMFSVHTHLDFNDMASSLLEHSIGTTREISGCLLSYVYLIRLSGLLILCEFLIETNIY